MGKTSFMLSGVSSRCSALSSRKDFPTGLKFEIRICAFRAVPSAPRFSFLYYAHRLVNFSLCLPLRKFFLPALSMCYNEGAVFSVGGGSSEKPPASSGQQVLSCPLRRTLLHRCSGVKTMLPRLSEASPALQVIYFLSVETFI